MIKQCKSGKSVDLNEMPPEISTGSKAPQNAAATSPSSAAAEPQKPKTEGMIGIITTL